MIDFSPIAQHSVHRTRRSQKQRRRRDATTNTTRTSVLRSTSPSQMSLSSSDPLEPSGRSESKARRIREQSNSSSSTYSVLVHSDRPATKGRSIERLSHSHSRRGLIDCRTRSVETSIFLGEEENRHSHRTNTDDFSNASLSNTSFSLAFLF